MRLKEALLLRVLLQIRAWSSDPALLNHHVAVDGAASEDQAF